MLIIKIGGGLSINLVGIVADLVSVNEKVVLVHGANGERNRLAEKMGYEQEVLKSVSGYSSVYSDEGLIDLQMMAYAGLVNKRIVSLCQQKGINAVGLCGLDGRVVEGRRNKGIRVMNKGKQMVVRDFSGKPFSVNRMLLDLLLDNGFVPILTIPLGDEEGIAINSENDDVVAVLQKEFGAERVVQLIEAPGFLEDVSDPRSVVVSMNRDDLVKREERVSGRMKRKMLALRRLFENGVETVVIGDGRVEHPLRDALNGGGTVIS